MPNHYGMFPGYGSPRKDTTKPHYAIRDDDPVDVDPMFLTFPKAEPLEYAGEQIAETPPEPVPNLTPSSGLKASGSALMTVLTAPEQGVLQGLDRENRYDFNRERTTPEIMEQYGIYDALGVGDASMTGEPWKDTPLNAARALGYGAASVPGILLTDPYNWIPGGYGAKKVGKTVAKTAERAGDALADSHLARTLADETGAIGPLKKPPEPVEMDIYHGRGSDFNQFDMSRAKDLEGRKAGLGLGKGKIYFHANPEVASNFAMSAPNRKLGNQPNVMPMRVRGNFMDEAEYHRRFEELSGGVPIFSSELNMAQRDGLIGKLDNLIKSEGYDGIRQVYYKPDGTVAEIGQVAVFDPDILQPRFDPRGL